MARKFQNLVKGTITNNPLAIGGTTLNSANLANLVAVTAPETLAITLDPDSINGAPEIVEVTAHTASATSATITRAAESTTARAHPLATNWVHAATKQDLDVFAAAGAGAPAPDTSNYFDRYTNVHAPIAIGTSYTDVTAMLDNQSNSGAPAWMPTWDVVGAPGPKFSVAGLYRLTYNINADGLAAGIWSFRADYVGFEPGSGFFWRQGAFGGVGVPLDLWIPDTVYIPANGKIASFGMKSSGAINISYLELYISKLA